MLLMKLKIGFRDMDGVGHVVVDSRSRQPMRAGAVFLSPADRGVDRHDRTPDWNYRRGESAGAGAYYDGGRYGPRGLLSADTPAPWLTQAGGPSRLAANDAARANRRFMKLADRNRDDRLTDAEIGTAFFRDWRPNAATPGQMQSQGQV